MASSSAFPLGSTVLPMLFTLFVAVKALAQTTPTPTAPKPDVPQANAPWANAPRAKRPKDAAALMTSLAKMRGLSIEFTEQKFLSLLAVPLNSSGRMHFYSLGTAESAVLVRIVDKPEPSKVTITARELRMADQHGTEVIDLRKSDRMRLFVISLLHVFQGNREALAKNYRLRYLPSKDSATRWRLELTPKRAPLNRILKQLVLHGDGEAVTNIEFRDANGDRTITLVQKADPKRTFTAVELREIFGITATAKKGS